MELSTPKRRLAMTVDIVETVETAGCSTLEGQPAQDGVTVGRPCRR